MHEKWLRIITVLSHLLLVEKRGRKVCGAWSCGEKAIGTLRGRLKRTEKHDDTDC